MREYFKNLPDETTPLEAGRINGLLNGKESIEKIVVGDIESKNLFNKYGDLTYKEGWSTGTTILQDDSTIKATSNYANGNGPGQLLKLRPNTIYTCSFEVKEFEVLGASSLRIYKKNGSLIVEKQFFTIGNYSFNITTDSSTDYYISFNGVANSSELNTFKYVIYDNVQIEKGSIATSYSEYKGIGYTSGTNENGSWVKYDDGRLIQEGTGQCPANVGYADITFPMAFIDTNYIMIANHKYTGGSEYGGSSQLLNITNPQNYTTTQAYIYSYLYDGSFAGYPRNVQYIAIGRWK